MQRFSWLRVLALLVLCIAPCLTVGSIVAYGYEVTLIGGYDTSRSFIGLVVPSVLYWIGMLLALWALPFNLFRRIHQMRELPWARVPLDQWQPRDVPLKAGVTLRIEKRRRAKRVILSIQIVSAIVSIILFGILGMVPLLITLPFWKQFPFVAFMMTSNQYGAPYLWWYVFGWLLLQMVLLIAYRLVIIIRDWRDISIQADDNGLTIGRTSIPWRAIRAVVRTTLDVQVRHQATYILVTDTGMVPFQIDCPLYRYESGFNNSAYPDGFDAYLLQISMLMATLAQRAQAPLRSLLERTPSSEAPFVNANRTVLEDPLAATLQAATLPRPRGWWHRRSAVPNPRGWDGSSHTIKRLTLRDALAAPILPPQNQPAVTPFQDLEQPIGLVPRLDRSLWYYLSRIMGVGIPTALLAYFFINVTQSATLTPQNAMIAAIVIGGVCAMFGGIILLFVFLFSETNRRQKNPTMVVYRDGTKPYPKRASSSFSSWRESLAWVLIPGAADDKAPPTYLLISEREKITWSESPNAMQAGRSTADRQLVFQQRAATVHALIANNGGLPLRMLNLEQMPAFTTRVETPEQSAKQSWLVVAEQGDDDARDLIVGLRQHGERVVWVDQADFIESELDDSTYCVLLSGDDRRHNEYQSIV